MAADIVMSDLTNGGIVEVGGQYKWQGTGIFDKLISAINDNIKVEYDNGRIVGQEYSTVYLGALQSVIAQSMQFLEQEKLLEAQIDVERQKIISMGIDDDIKQAQSAKDLLVKDKQIADIAEGTLLKGKQIDTIVSEINSRDEQSAKDLLVKDKQIADIAADTAAKDYALLNLQPITKSKAQEELQVMLDTHASKVAISGYQADKVGKDVAMTAAQIKALEEQVIDNRYIKAIDSLSSVYGTFGAGGINVSSDQWGMYYKLISEMIEDLRDYKGVWNAAGPFPGPADGTVGDFYVVSVTGNTSLDGIASWTANDIAFYDGAKWKKLAASPSTAGIGRV